MRRARFSIDVAQPGLGQRFAHVVHVQTQHAGGQLGALVALDDLDRGRDLNIPTRGVLDPATGLVEDLEGGEAMLTQEDGVETPVTLETVEDDGAEFQVRYSD